MTRSATNREWCISKGMVWQSVWKGMQEGHCNSAGSTREAMVSTWQKAMASLNSAPAMTDTASQTALMGTYCYPGVRLQDVPYTYASTRQHY